MKQAVLVDAGPLVALLDRRDRAHAWAVEQLFWHYIGSMPYENVLLEVTDQSEY